MCMATIDPAFHSDKHYAMSQLSEIRDNIESELKAELDAIMQKVLAMAIEICPKDTGALASSISLENGVISASDFYGSSIYAGDENIINPKTGVPTSEYAGLVHDGHGNYEGVPFLAESLMFYEEQLASAVEKALKSLGETEPSAGKIADMENE